MAKLDRSGKIILSVFMAIFGCLLVFVLALGPIRSHFHCYRPAPGQPGECAIDEYYVFSGSRHIAFPEPAIRDAKMVMPHSHGGRGAPSIPVKLVLAGSEPYPVMYYEWAPDAERAAKLLQDYLKDRSRLSFDEPRNIYPESWQFSLAFAAILGMIILIKTKRAKGKPA